MIGWVNTHTHTHTHTHKNWYEKPSTINKHAIENFKHHKAGKIYLKQTEETEVTYSGHVKGREP